MRATYAFERDTVDNAIWIMMRLVLDMAKSSDDRLQEKMGDRKGRRVGTMHGRLGSGLRWVLYMPKRSVAHLILCHFWSVANKKEKEWFAFRRMAFNRRKERSFNGLFYGHSWYTLFAAAKSFLNVCVNEYIPILLYQICAFLHTYIFRSIFA